MSNYINEILFASNISYLLILFFQAWLVVEYPELLLGVDEPDIFSQVLTYVSLVGFIGLMLTIG